MKIPFVLTLFFIVTSVSAGGFQNCLERVWLFQSFLIDQHNPEAAQTIGYKCRRWRAGACEGNVWDKCRPRNPRTQCNFWDFQRHLGGLRPGMSDQAVLRADGSFDSIETAKKCLWDWRDHGGPPHNFKGYNSFRNGRDDHNHFIRSIGRINNDNYNNAAVRGAAGDDAFRNADDTLNKINRFRIADHGRHLLPAAQNNLGANVARKDMGASPFYRATWVPPPNVDPDTPQLATVDWDKTINDSPSPAAMRAKVRVFLDNFYREDGASRSAKEHWEVLRSLKTVKDQTNRCRRR